jgi:hypothetical protein
MADREEQHDDQAERVTDEGQGADTDDAEEQAGQPGSEGQGEDGQASGNPDNAG